MSVDSSVFILEGTIRIVQISRSTIVAQPAYHCFGDLGISKNLPACVEQYSKKAGIGGHGDECGNVLKLQLREESEKPYLDTLFAFGGRMFFCAFGTVLAMSMIKIGVIAFYLM